jgi:hypothetical protein
MKKEKSLLNEFILDSNKAKTAYHTSCKNILLEAFRKMFETYPELHCIAWKQYTPAWNDGSPCVLRISPEMIALSLKIVPLLPKNENGERLIFSAEMLCGRIHDNLPDIPYLYKQMGIGEILASQGIATLKDNDGEDIAPEDLVEQAYDSFYVPGFSELLQSMKPFLDPTFGDAYVTVGRDLIIHSKLYEAAY